MKIDPTDLVDAAEIADMLGLASNRAVSTYRARYDTFPEPVIEKASGKCVLWLRTDIEDWARKTDQRHRHAAPRAEGNA